MFEEFDELELSEKFNGFFALSKMVFDLINHYCSLNVAEYKVLLTFHLHI